MLFLKLILLCTGLSFESIEFIFSDETKKGILKFWNPVIDLIFIINSILVGSVLMIFRW